MTRRPLFLLVLSLLVLSLIACQGGGVLDDWVGIDRSNWAWDGSQGDRTVLTEWTEYNPTPTPTPLWAP